MKKVLISGSTGMLGSHLIRSFRDEGQYEIYGLARSLTPLLAENRQFCVDLADPLSVSKVNIVPDVIIHTAALTDLAGCERNPVMADKIHVQGSRALAKVAEKHTLFIYISTDSVFDGESGGYTELDQPRPLNEYAESKLRGERAVQEENKGLTTIVRTNIYGLNTPLKNSLAEWAYKEWMAGKAISGFSDVTFNAVFTGQLAQVIRLLIDRQKHFPILNVASSEAISKYHFLDRFREILGVDSALLKNAVSTDFPSTIKRPRNTSLDTSLLLECCPAPEFLLGMQQWVEYGRELGVVKK